MRATDSALAPETAAWLDRERDRLVAEWRDALRIPSVSAGPSDGPRRMADWLEGVAAPRFDRFERLETSAGAPVLLGAVDGTGPDRLLLYSHYDVVPPGEGWTTDPFGAEIRDGAVVARGAGDDKADVMARLHALEAWNATRGRLPFDVIWLCEGMEEVGSPGLGETIAAHRERLRADACLWESYYRSIDGVAPTLGFGSRGVLNVELSLRVLESDQAAGAAALYRSAAAELVHAIAKLIDAEGRVLIDGFYDTVAAWSDADAALVAASPPAPSSAPAPEGVDPRLSDDAAELTRRWLYEPTVSLAAIHAGPVDPADAGSVLPASARARLDFRLVPDQDPKAILGLLRSQLQRLGFGEISVELRNAIPPARCPLDTPLADAARQAARELFGAEPVCHAIVPGSGPLHHFARDLGIPTVMPPGTIRPDSGMHGPDENALVEHYLAEVVYTVRLLELLSERGAIT